MRNVRAIFFISALCIAVMAVPSVGFARGDCKPSTKHLAGVTTNNYYAPILIGNILNYYGNNGDGSFNLLNHYNEGFEFPKGSGKTAVFEEGIIWGGYHHRNINGIDTAILKVGGSTYDHGLQPGRILSPGTATTTAVADDPNNPSYRIYRVRPDIRPSTDPASIAAQDSILANTELLYTNRFMNQTVDQLREQYWKDWNEWPAVEGAPYTDVNHNGVYDPGMDIPGVPGADQTLWYVANDLDSERTQGLYGSNPIGVEMQRTIWAYNNSGLMGNIIFMKTKLINKSGSAIDSMFVGQWADPDVGSAVDDFAGCDTTLSLGYAYNGSDIDAVYGDRPPAVGWTLLEGPMVAGNSADTVSFEGRRVPDCKNLGLYSFDYFVCGGDPGEPPLNDPRGTPERYNNLKGLFGPAGLPYINPLTGEPTRFSLSGDPVAGEGWIDGSGQGCGDRYLLESSGPFRMAPEDSEEIIVAAVIGQGNDRLSSITVLREVAQVAEMAFRNSFKGSCPEASVTSSFVAGQSTRLSVNLVYHGSCPVGTAVTLRRYDGTPVASTELSDKGGGNYAGSLDVQPQDVGLYLDAAVKYQDGTSLTWPHLADDISTAGPLSIASYSVASDNLNSDGRVNPGENIRYFFAIKNPSSYSFSSLTVRPDPSHDYKTLPIASLNAGELFSLTYDRDNPSTYFSFDVPSDYTYPKTNVLLTITDIHHNKWVDTLAFRVIPLQTSIFSLPPERLSGTSSGNFEISLVNSSQVKNHFYVITGVDSIDAKGSSGYTLKGSTSGEILLANYPLPDSLGHNSPIVDAFKILLGTIDPFHGMASHSESRAFHWSSSRLSSLNLEGFYGSIGNGYDNWPSGSTVTYNKLKDVEIVFALTDTLGDIINQQDPNASLSYRYILNADQPPAQPSFAAHIVNRGHGYAYQEYSRSLPFAAYDIQSKPRRRLMVGFTENNVPNGLLDGKYWPPCYFGGQINGDNVTETGPREWFLIFDETYSTTPDTILEKDLLSNTLPIMWFGTVTRSPGVYWSRPDTFWIVAHHPISSNDRWVFNPYLMLESDTTSPYLPQSFELYQNYPNPFNPSTTIRFGLPKASKVTIKIYNVLGQELARVFDGVLTRGIHSVVWNSTNYSGNRAASGVYFCMIEAEEIGTPHNLFRKTQKMILLR